MVRDFKALKLGVISLWRLLFEYKRIGPETRSALIKALVIEHNFQHAFQLIQEQANILKRWFASFWSDPRGVDSFKKEMKKAAAGVSDSEFLQKLASTDDEGLRHAVQNAKDLAQRELTSSIETVVKNMTRAVLEIQRQTSEKSLQLQIGREEGEELNNAQVEFIREINKNSAERQNSCVSLSFKELS